MMVGLLEAMCGNKENWRMRIKGAKIVQLLATSMGSAVLHHLKILVGLIKSGLEDKE